MYRITHRRSPSKKFHRRLLGLTTALALVLTALVVACGEPEPEPRAEPTDTPRALSPLSSPGITDTPRPTNTPIPDATAVVVVTKEPTTAATPTPTLGPAPTLSPPADFNGDYDADADGLIEVSNLAQLDAIRYDVDGNGLVADSKEQTEYLAAFPGALEDMGCPVGGCSGYEVVSDLDFDTNGNGVADAGDAYWNDGSGWAPLGYYRGADDQRLFKATFDGGGYTISNMFISRADQDNVGLFGITCCGYITNVVLVEIDVTGNDYVGGLVGDNEEGGRIRDSAVSGVVTGNDYVGGLVGDNKEGGRINDSSANGSVTGNRYVGGLVGRVDGHFGSAVRDSSSSSVVDGVDFVAAWSDLATARSAAGMPAARRPATGMSAAWSVEPMVATSATAPPPAQ